MVEHAVELGRAGFRVHPLKAKDQPYTKYSLTATSDEARIRNLWRRWPNALIGIVTGGGLVVVDDDRCLSDEPDPSMSTTLTATTPRGGFHYYFRCATPLRNSVGKLAERVDVRGEGGYVVAPPGEGRQWWHASPPLTGLAPLPSVLLAACLKIEQEARRAFEPRDHVPVGQRHDYLVQFAGWLVANEVVDEDDVLDETIRHALQVCDPWHPSELPGVKRHIAQIVRWVLDRERRED